MSSLSHALSLLFYEHHKKVKDLFLELDIDGDGTLSANELRNGLYHRFAILCSVEECEELLRSTGSHSGTRFRYSDLVTFLDSTSKEVYTMKSAAYATALLGHASEYKEGEVEKIELSPERKRQILVATIRRKIGQSNTELRKVFLSWDTNRKGQLNYDELKNGFKSIGLNVSDRDLKLTLAEYDVSGTGGVNYNEFLKFATSYGSSNDESFMSRMLEDRLVVNPTEAYTDFSAKLPQECIDIPDSSSDAEVVETIESFLLEKKKKLKTLFKEFDTNNNGFVSRKEFEAGLEKIGFSISPERVERLINKYDQEKNGRLKYWEFVRMVSEAAKDEEDITAPEVPTDEHPEDLALLKHLSEVIYERCRKLRKAFKKLDKTGEGTISAEELQTGMKRMGVNMTEDVAKRIVKRYDDKGDGVLHYHEFVRLMSAQ